ncbi:MAG: 6-bladed beta-propeller [Actinobacteria bacterium]|nr:6-bladed beta-propeller [Actinomycetota bacterium]
MTKIGKRILLSLLSLVALSAGVGVATYLYLDATFNSKPSGQVDVVPQYSYSITGVGKSALKGPLGGARVGDRVFVADSANRKIAIFDLNGTPIDSFKPVPEVETAYPMMVAADRKQRVYVTVTVGSVYKIMVYDRKGKFLYAFPDGLMKGFGVAASLNKPVGLFVTDDRLYVTDIGDQDVKIFNPNGQLVKRFGGPGHGEGEFSYPNGIAADRPGNIYVSDSNNARVQVFDKNGRYKLTFNSGAKRLAWLPRGIAVDALGRIHVVDAFNHKVLVFSSSGNLLFSYGEQGNAVDAFYYPNGITIDQNGGTFIADRQNNRIAVWQVK